MRFKYTQTRVNMHVQIYMRKYKCTGVKFEKQDFVTKVPRSRVVRWGRGITFLFSSWQTAVWRNGRFP